MKALTRRQWIECVIAAALMSSLVKLMVLTSVPVWLIYATTFAIGFKWAYLIGRRAPPEPASVDTGERAQTGEDAGR